MAIVMEFKCANGARVLVADDCYRNVPAEEQERRRREMGREILRIDRKLQLARLAEAQMEKMAQERRPTT